MSADQGRKSNSISKATKGNRVAPLTRENASNRILHQGTARSQLPGGEYLIIRSSDASRVTTILGDYKRRWEIEILFKALKGQGFDFAATHLTELDRIEKLLALLAIAFCWAHLLGEWLHE